MPAEETSSGCNWDTVSKFHQEVWSKEFWSAKLRSSTLKQSKIGWARLRWGLEQGFRRKQRSRLWWRVFACCFCLENGFEISFWIQLMIEIHSCFRFWCCINRIPAILYLQSMRKGAKHFFRRKKSGILGAPLGEFSRFQNYQPVCPKFRTFSKLGEVLQCFLRCFLNSKVSLNISNSY